MTIRARRLSNGKIRYDVKIHRDYRTLHLGTYDSEVEARQANAEGIKAYPPHYYRYGINKAAAEELIGKEAVQKLYEAGFTIRLRT